MAAIYIPQDWYWSVNGDQQARVYSSKAGDYVPTSDPAFLASGITPSQATSEAEIGTTLAPFYPTITRPVPVAILDGYTQGQANSVVITAIFKVEFNHENRLRAIERNLGLNGSPPNIAPAQALAAVKSLL